MVVFVTEQSKLVQGLIQDLQYILDDINENEGVTRIIWIQMVAYLEYDNEMKLDLEYIPTNAIIYNTNTLDSDQTDLPVLECHDWPFFFFF